MKYEKIIEVIATNIMGIIALLIVMVLFKGSSSEGFISYLLACILFRVLK